LGKGIAEGAGHPFGGQLIRHHLRDPAADGLRDLQGQAVRVLRPRGFEHARTVAEEPGRHGGPRQRQLEGAIQL